MLHKLASLFIILIAIISCKGPEARRPVQQSSGTFIQESAQRNKALYDEEKEHIQKIIDADTTKDYISSDTGFWYYYNIKDSIASPKPDYGDETVSYTHLTLPTNREV